MDKGMSQKRHTEGGEERSDGRTEGGRRRGERVGEREERTRIQGLVKVTGYLGYKKKGGGG